MKLQTLFSLVNVPVAHALVELPPGKPGYFSVGTLRGDGGMDLLATLNIEGIALTPERRNTILRLLQMIGEGCCDTSDRPRLRILARQDAPDVVDNVSI